MESRCSISEHGNEPGSRQAHRGCSLMTSLASGPQEACERSLAEMESSHQQVMEQLQRHHERELQRLQQEKEWLLAEETAATASGEDPGCAWQRLVPPILDWEALKYGRVGRNQWRFGSPRSTLWSGLQRGECNSKRPPFLPWVDFSSFGSIDIEKAGDTLSHV